MIPPFCEITSDSNLLHFKHAQQRRNQAEDVKELLRVGIGWVWGSLQGYLVDMGMMMWMVFGLSGFAFSNLFIVSMGKVWTLVCI